MIECSLEQTLLAPEVVVNKPVVHTRPVGNFATGHTIGSTFGQKIDSRLHERPPRITGLC